MTTIRVEQFEPEMGSWRVRLTLDTGKFSDADLAVIRQATDKIGRFDGGRRNVINLTYNRNLHPHPALLALAILRKRYPDATMTSYGDTSKKLIADSASTKVPLYYGGEGKDSAYN